MADEKISDIPSIQNLLQQSRGMLIAKKIMPFASPFLKLVGIDADKISKALEMAEDLNKEIKELSTLPDRFNNCFLDRGWIIYASLNLEVTKDAILKAEAGDFEAGEKVLIDYFTPTNVRSSLKFVMRPIKAFQPRMRLAELACLDYEAFRYHACILVLLALMDGLVNELNDGHGFFADATDLEAWDSIAAHKRGLVVLGKIFRSRRNKTQSEKITFPYRNGIIHGNDLDYDNLIVAAKTWAALFAIGEWASKAEKGQLTQPPAKSKPSLFEVLKEYKQVQDDKELLDQWQPRILHIDQDIPASGETNAYQEHSPEQKFAEFLNFWKKKNYGNMAKCCGVIGQVFEVSPLEIRGIYEDIGLVDFKLIEITDIAPAVTQINTFLMCKKNGQSFEKEYAFRVFYLNEVGLGEPRSKPGNTWYVFDWEYFH